LSTPKMLICTEDKSRMAATNFRSIGGRNLSYFVGVDATQTSPKMFLSGDDNLLVNGVPARPGLLILTTNSAIAWSQRRHGGQGNVALADGSVQQFSPERLTEALRNTGAVTNRILLP
jgi:prepilin-type processing-associated H-X9-DG protein